jgi:hypothetical protein
MVHNEPSRYGKEQNSTTNDQEPGAIFRCRHDRPSFLRFALEDFV